MIYKPVGQCIYCGDTHGLQKEHILPFGLSGTAILPEASCAKCARITGHHEQMLLRGPMWAVRVYRTLNSRTKHRDAPRAYPLTLLREGEEKVVKLPVEEYPILLHFPVFTPPAILDPSGYTSGIRVSGTATLSFGPHPAAVAKRYGATSIKLTQSWEPVAFAQVIAKVALAYAVAEGARRWIEGAPWPVPAILGKADDIGRWVGTLTEPFRKFDGVLHRLAVHKDTEKGLVIVEVQLFSDSQAPSYGVILGRLIETPEP